MDSAQRETLARLAQSRAEICSLLDPPPPIADERPRPGHGWCARGWIAARASGARSEIVAHAAQRGDCSNARRQGDCLTQGKT
jgi:hypothetical protein